MSFHEDVEFHNGALPSHHGAGHGQPVQQDTASRPGLAGDPPAAAEAGSIPGEAAPADGAPAEGSGVIWLEAAEGELKKVPFFVRGKARRNTEIFARERGIGEIGVDTTRRRPIMRAEPVTPLPARRYRLAFLTLDAHAAGPLARAAERLARAPAATRWWGSSRTRASSG